MTTGINARDELEATVAEYRHVQSEHRRAGAESTVRRHLHSRLSRLGSRFERLLEEYVADEGTREAWRRRLHEGSPAPAGPPEPSLPVTGRARSSARSSKRLLRRVPASPVRVESRAGSMPPPPPGPSAARSR